MVHLRAVLAIAAGSALVACPPPPSTPIEMVVWHTEQDPSAMQVVDSVARIVADEFIRRGIPVHFSITAQPWGDVASRIFLLRDNPPDITHLEPFMVRQVLQTFRGVDDFSVHPLDSLLSRLEQQLGPVYPAVRDLHKYSTHSTGGVATFGIAHAIGTTYAAYRRDWMPAATQEPATWEALVEFADRLAKNGHRQTGMQPAPFILPGKSPFFIEQFLNELVVSLGGTLYDAGRPALDSPEMRRALRLLQDMIARTGGTYQQTTYLEQFTSFGNGAAAVMPVTYGRATKQIEAAIGHGGAASDTDISRFGVWRQAGAVAGDTGVSTIDAEPWVIIARRSSDPTRGKRLAIAERFLELFYDKALYLSFCTTVPIHLRPIFPSLEGAYDSSVSQSRWPEWRDLGRGMLASGKTAPILMDRTGSPTPQPTFALSLQRTGVLSDMVLESVPTEVLNLMARRLQNGGPESLAERVRREAAIEQAISRAQLRALALHAGDGSAN